MNKYYYKEFYVKPVLKWMYHVTFLVVAVLITTYGCRTVFYPAKVPERKLDKMGYAVQLGAF
ncbi:MAG: hypothetical protein JRJ39_06345, partial [Deltaproteobacteria bacterium]|nr:hypothetical protein [Deltaproteobacteria bacterium]MBW2364844.1 hypothetical protein [Deltaproteobacteria bacterium]